MVSLRQLRYALAVEQTHHFRKASEACAVSQSALSTAIQELESQYFEVIKMLNGYIAFLKKKQ